MKKIDFSPFLTEAKEQQLCIEGVVIWQGGEEIAGCYVIPERRRNQFSVSKSFTSTAVGFAIAEGLFALADKILPYFKEEVPRDPSEYLQQVTVRDLLTMTFGQEEAYLMGDERPLIAAQTDDFVAYALAQPLAYAPGGKFVYNNVGPYLAGMLIQKRTGQDLVSYLMPRLFEPLGIARPQWEADPKGNTFGAGGLQISVSELAKFSQLYLQKGYWQGKQVLPNGWAEEATKCHVDNKNFYPKEITDNRLGYGYLFWRGQHGSYRADGKDAKFGIVLEDKDAVIAVNADTPKAQAVLDLVWAQIYPQL